MLYCLMLLHALLMAPSDLRHLTHNSPPRQRTEADAKLQLLDRCCSVLLMFASLAATPFAIGAKPPITGSI